jgi:hypothetical protein
MGTVQSCSSNGQGRNLSKGHSQSNEQAARQRTSPADRIAGFDRPVVRSSVRMSVSCRIRGDARAVAASHRAATAELLRKYGVNSSANNAHKAINKKTRRPLKTISTFAAAGDKVKSHCGADLHLLSLLPSLLTSQEHRALRRAESSAAATFGC